MKSSEKRNNELNRVLLSDGTTIGLEGVFLDVIKIIAPQGIKVNEYCNNVISGWRGGQASTASIVRQSITKDLINFNILH